jgi:SAM-dependent methyltransferase
VPSSLTQAFRTRWREARAQYGRWGALRRLLGETGEFLRDSTPARKRSRYGDMDFDWEHRVDTSAGTVDNRTRLASVLGGSPYQPSEPSLFHQMLDGLALDWPRFTFLDLGSGKGRALLMAADYPFRRIVGVEFVPELHQVALDNIRKYRGMAQKDFAIECVCGDAREFEFPPEPLLLYLFNPLPEPALQKVVDNLERSLAARPREAFILYHNPELERVLAQRSGWKKVGGTHQYVVYAAA